MITFNVGEDKAALLTVTLLGLLVSGTLEVQAVMYWYHRFQHRFSFAWRMLHQVHHGVPRVDIPSALVAHPLDVIVSTTLSILVTAFLLGLDLRAVAIVSVLQFFITLFPHWNVRTPNWVGYPIQRPEEHILNHQREAHGGNFSDWPLWDKLFGTYRAPVEEPIRVGFDKAEFAEQLKMLAFVDVNAPAESMEGVLKVQPGRAACVREMHL